jgi:hypothetical protein
MLTVQLWHTLCPRPQRAPGLVVVSLAPLVGNTGQDRSHVLGADAVKVQVQLA